MKYIQEQNRFYIPGAPGQEDIAEIKFHREGDKLAVIDHTYVNINYRNEGIGEHLVELVVELMRKEQRQIKPHCPFAKQEFHRVPSYHDIWYH